VHAVCSDASAAAQSVTTIAIFPTSTKSSKAVAVHALKTQNTCIDGIVIEWHHHIAAVNIVVALI
ncbi:MAG TPA: hypothetical protein VFX63_04365, partial [Pyrinomonadaceae bacterium]|nr:hypothetical protein [Pyrinomonadaceae bacterium]